MKYGEESVTWNPVPQGAGRDDLSGDDPKMGQISGSHAEKQEVLSQACTCIW